MSLVANRDRTLVTRGIHHEWLARECHAMKVCSLFLVAVTFSLGCSSSRDQLELQEAKNRELYLELQRERAINERARTQGVPNTRPEPAALADRPGQAKPPEQANAAEKPPDAATKQTDTVEKSIPKDSVTNAAIDNGFKQWSASWMFDQYIPGSARATDRGFKNGTYVIRGLFGFARMGARLDIPFAAAFTNSANGYVLSNLCYNDNSSGMTDCTNPSDAAGQQRAALQSRQFLGSIVMLGLASALSSETCEKRYSFFGEPYLLCY